RNGPEPVLRLRHEYGPFPLGRRRTRPDRPRRPDPHHGFHGRRTGAPLLGRAVRKVLQPSRSAQRNSQPRVFRRTREIFYRPVRWLPHRRSAATRHLLVCPQQFVAGSSEVINSEEAPMRHVIFACAFVVTVCTAASTFADTITIGPSKDA